MRVVGPLVLLVSMSFSGTAMAAGQQQDEDGPYVSVGTLAVGSSKFDKGKGEVGSSTVYINGGYSWLNVSYARTGFSWSDVNTLPFGNGSDDPWDSLHTFAISSDHDGMFNEEWGWFAGASVGVAYEDEMSGAWGENGYVGGIYALSEHAAITFGLAASNHKTGFDVLPLLSMNWNYVEEDGSGWFAALGFPETNVGYAFSDELSLTLGLGGEGGVYRLADDSTVRREGYVSMEDMNVSLAAAWTPYENVTLTLAPSYHFDRSMTLYDKSGDKDKSHDLGNTAGVRLDLSVAF